MNNSEQYLVRLEKINKLHDNGIEPFGKAFKRDSSIVDILNKYSKKDGEFFDQKKLYFSIAGRVMLKRGQGKAGFMHIKDASGLLQIYTRLNDLGENVYNKIVKESDLGDIIGVKGYLFKTRTNELTLRVEEYTHLSKSLRPLPDKFHGLADKEIARRKRYLDLLTNSKSFDVAIQRSKLIKIIRQFFDEKNFIEVETPILQKSIGGASARPFYTHHNALDMNFSLRIATELPLKKLIVGGMEAVYEIGRLFRNEGMDSSHNPEFTTVEAYLAYSDMEGMMNLIEDLLVKISNSLLNSSIVEYDNKSISFEKPISRLHMVEAIQKDSGVDFFKVQSKNEAEKLAKKHDVEIKPYFTFGHIVEAFFDKFSLNKIVQPTFIYGHPIEISPLAKKSDHDPRFTERFELFIAGKEYANAFTEINNPIEQKKRFESQIEQRKLGNEETSDIDFDYIEALEYGMPPTGGLGIGIDRLAMLFTNTPNIRDVILFPHLKNKE
jgi:lysyl-tRNA synthetase class 2